MLPIPTEVPEKKPDFFLAARLFNQQEDRLTELQRLMAYGKCRNPEVKCNAPRRAEAYAEHDLIRFQWAECERCGYCDDGPD